MMKKLLWIAFISVIAYFVPGNQAATCSNAPHESECQDFRLVPTRLTFAAMQLNETANNHSNTLRATIACIPLPETPEQCQDRLFVERRKTGQVFELKTECFLPWRPISNLRWNTDSILVFDQWANPHFGHHYAVNMANAALHWINEPEAVINSIWKALKTGGRFVAEFGGKGNVNAIINALNKVLTEFGYPSPEKKNPWYYPSIGEYAKLLENQGFEVVYAVLFDRPTPLEGDAGIANWVQMFGSYFLSKLSTEQQTNTIQAVENRLQPILYRDGIWYADYRRIRVLAIKK